MVRNILEIRISTHERKNTSEAYWKELDKLNIHDLHDKTHHNYDVTFCNMGGYDCCQNWSYIGMAQGFGSI